MSSSKNNYYNYAASNNYNNYATQSHQPAQSAYQTKVTNSYFNAHANALAQPSPQASTNNVQSVKNAHQFSSFPSKQSSHYPVYSHQNAFSAHKVVPRQPSQQHKSVYASQVKYATPTSVQQQSSAHAQKNSQQANKSLLAGSGLINASGSAFYDF